MTKKELEKEASEKYFNHKMADFVGFYERHFYYLGYVEGAESRENRIAELEAYNEKLLNGDIEKHNKIVELEKELEQAKKVQVVEHFEAYGQCRDSRRIAGLEAENAEQKKKIENLQKYLDTQNCYRECAETWEKLIYAKTIIQDLLDNSDEYARQRATDFLKESENE